jgi:hypothetical protein
MLSLVENGSTAATLNLSGQYSSANFSMANDGQGGTSIGFMNPPPASATTADMILRHASDGQYEIYNIGNNAILAGNSLGQVGIDWQFAGLGGFNGGGTTDMLLRSSTTGGFAIYNIANNNITGAAFLGTVGLDWQVMGFGNFSSMPGETDMIMRNSNTGGVEVYDINNNQIANAAFLGTVGLNWQFSGVGNFSGRGESDMLLRNANTGGLEVYDIANNMITGAAFIGTVGLDWQFSGVGNFSGVPGETDLLLRNVNTGGWKCTTSPTISSSAPPSWAQWVWIGSSRASRQSTPLERPISCCATSTPAHSRSTTSPAIKSWEQLAWVRSDWTGSSGALPPIRRAARAHPWVTRVKSANSCKRWRALAAATARTTARMRSPSAPTRRRSSF